MEIVQVFVTVSRLLQMCCLWEKVNSFSAKGNIELFANNVDSGESSRNELSHLKSALFGCEL